VARIFAQNGSANQGKENPKKGKKNKTKESKFSKKPTSV
jgi:hypothetical protein